MNDDPAWDVHLQYGADNVALPKSELETRMKRASSDLAALEAKRDAAKMKSDNASDAAYGGLIEYITVTDTRYK